MTDVVLDPETPLNIAQAWLREHLDEGAPCPCCTQLARRYKRTITSSSARSLITVWRTVGHGTGHWPTILNHGGADEAKMVHWGLIDEAQVERDDGGRAGYWRITDLGARWVRGEVTVPKFIHLYDGRLLGRPFGMPWSITQALGKRFDLQALLDGEG